MCGIWSYISKTKKSKACDILYNNFSKIKHRGPDRSSFIELNKPINIKLGFHRLAIMDLSLDGDQPFLYENDNHSIYSLTNGEIYNYKKLIEKYDLKCRGNSDCEVVPLLYMKGGIDLVLNEILGEWALILVDINHLTNETSIYCSRDQFGVRPLFYCEDEQGYGFCSELKGLFNLFTNSIKPLIPSYLMKIVVKDGEEISSTYEKYYEYDYKIDLTMDVGTIKSTIRELLTESVISRLDSDRPIGCLLSGGIDSSIIAAISANYLSKKGEKLRTFSIGTEDSPDVHYAQMVADHIGSIHTFIKFDPVKAIEVIPKIISQIESYDVTTIRASVPMWFLLEWISLNTEVKVILSGEYSDEVAGSYLYFHNAPSSDMFSQECIRLVKDIYMYDSLRADRIIAGNGIEARIPYSDKKYIEFYMTIDPSLRRPRPSKELGISQNTEKALLREAFVNTGLLPKEVLVRIKSAFSDAITSDKKSWYQYIEEYVEEIIDDKEINNYEWSCDIVTIRGNVILRPISKESLYYRKIFNDIYCQQVYNDVIPYYWLPKWSGDISNPSARVLDVYKKEE